MASFFWNLGLIWLTPKHEAFLVEYESEIQKKVNVSFNDRHEREDVKQEIRLELIKAYKNHKRYADWHNIVLSVMNRRIIDYKSKLYRTPLFTTVIRGNMNVDDALTFMQFLIDQHHQEFVADGTGDAISKVEASDYLETILSLYAWSEDEFTDWEQEYMERMYASYKMNPNCPIEKESMRMELMGIDRAQKHNPVMPEEDSCMCLSCFRKKSRNFIIKLREIMSRGE